MIGTLGDKVLVTIRGQMVRGYIVGVRRRQRAPLPSFDTNNVVLVDNDGAPLGTRILVPVPAALRARAATNEELARVLALATKFV